MRLSTALFAASLALAACAAPAAVSAGAAREGPWSVQLVDEHGRELPTFQHRGRTYVLGTLGRRYLVRVRNDSARRIEVVVSVDGRDVIDGRPASFGKRGYLVDGYSSFEVDGFRVSDASVAAFRFSSVPRSYAARMGDARDVGVIGVAVFPEAMPRPRPPPVYRPWESDDEVGGGHEDRSALPPPEPESGAPSAGRGEAQAQSAPKSAEPRRDRERRGLGTEFGEERDSRVTHVHFERASATPSALLTLRYDDRPGLVALGIDVDGGRDDAWLRASARPFRGYAEPPPGWDR